MPNKINQVQRNLISQDIVSGKNETLLKTDTRLKTLSAMCSQADCLPTVWGQLAREMESSGTLTSRSGDSLSRRFNQVECDLWKCRDTV